MVTLTLRQPWPLSVAWSHGTGDIRFATSHFILVVLWNRASIYIGFWRYWAVSMLQYPSRKGYYFFRGGPDPRKWRRAPDGCVTPLIVNASPGVIFSRPDWRSRYWYSVACVVDSSSSVTWSIVAKRCVLEQKLLLRAYRKSHIRNWLVSKWMTLTFV